MPRKPRNPKRSLAYGMGYTTVRGETTVQARWFDGVRWRAKTFHGHDLDEARDRAEEHIRIESRRAIDPDTHEYTVTDIVESWLKRGQTRWTANTASQYRFQYTTHVLPHLGALRARDVTTARIQYWIDGLVASGLSAATVRLIYVVLAGSMKEATRLGIVRVNPAQGIALPSIRKRPKVTWTVEQVQRVFAAVEGDAFWSALYRFALTTGVRPGELMALRWSDVDLDAGHATIARTMTRTATRGYTVGDETKTHQTRTVAVPPSTIAALKSWRREQAALRLASSYWHDDLVFSAVYGHHLDRSVWDRYHNALCVRAKVPRITLHGTRHTLATLMMASNTHPVVVQSILGHQSIRTTLDQYSHPGTDLQERAVGALDEQFSGTKKAK